MDDNQFWFKLWSVVAVCLAVVILGTTMLTAARDTEMARLGYEQAVRVGSAGTMWIRSPEVAR